MRGTIKACMTVCVALAVVMMTLDGCTSAPPGTPGEQIRRAYSKSPQFLGTQVFNTPLSSTLNLAKNVLWGKGILFREFVQYGLHMLESSPIAPEYSAVPPTVIRIWMEASGPSSTTVYYFRDPYGFNSALIDAMTKSLE